MFSRGTKMPRDAPPQAPSLGRTQAPAVVSLVLASLTGGCGPGPLAVLGLAAFNSVVLAMMVRQFAAVPFAMSW